MRYMLIAMLSVLGLRAADDLAGVMARMDKAASAFRGLSANVTKVTHTAVVPDDDIQTGKIVVRRAKPHELMLRVDIEPPNQETAVLDSTKAEIYYPKSNTLQPYLIGKSARPMVEQLLTIGWGTTSQELKNAYDVAYEGQEMVDRQPTVRLQLIPKDKDLLSHLPKLELWISEEPAISGTVVQVKMYQRGGKDYVLATYKDIKLRSVSESEVKMNAPKDAHREKPIKY